MRFHEGDRVKVKQDQQFPPGPFPSEPCGTVRFYPGSKSSYREMAGANGTIEFYWVVFDQPALDADGDGPYEAAKVLSKYLESIAQ